MRIQVQRTGPVAYVVLDHPKRHNAVDWPMLSELLAISRELGADRTLRAVILRGEGPSFCSGLDFPSFTKQPGRIVQSFLPRPPRPANLFQQACYGWRQLSVPVIAVLHGRCYGAGLQLALAADFRFATPNCQLSILEAKWGLVPDMSGTVALRELVGIDQAKRLTFTGEVIEGREASALGLVTEACDDPLAAAEALASKVCERSPDSVAAAKSLLQGNWVSSERSALARERRLQALVMLGHNFRRALKANFDKVAPSFGPRGWFL